jgi:hypothetical protein
MGRSSIATRHPLPAQDNRSARKGSAHWQGKTEQVIILEPVIETCRAQGFTAWPVGARLDFEGLVLVTPPQA